MGVRWGRAESRFARHEDCPDCGAPRCNGSCAEGIAEASARRSAELVRLRERTDGEAIFPEDAGAGYDHVWRSLLEGI